MQYSKRLEQLLKILKESDEPIHVSDLRQALPSPRPGILELERLLLLNDELFQFLDGDRIALISTDVVGGGDRLLSADAFTLPKLSNLLGYYEDCVREDGKRIRVYGNHLGISARETETEWVSENRAVYAIKVSTENKDLILNSSNDAAAHYYGYPLLAQWIEEESIMKFVPILYWKLDRIGSSNKSSHRLSFTLQKKYFRLNPEALWSIPRRQQKKVEELFNNAQSLTECLEMIQADFLGHEVKEMLFYHRLPRNPNLKDLGKGDEGIYNRGLFISLTPNSYVKGLASELSLLAKAYRGPLPQSSLDALILTDNPPLRKSIVVVPATRVLNAYQEAAVIRAFENDLSVVTGPPGTGKSEVILGIIANAILNDKSVLFASRNNAAITVVQKRADRLLGSRSGMLRLGGKFDKDTKQKLKLIFSQPPVKELADAKRKAEEYDKVKTCVESIVASLPKYENFQEDASNAEARFFEVVGQFRPQKCSNIPGHYTSADMVELEDLISNLQSSEWVRKVPFLGQRLFRKRIEKLSSQFSASLKRIERLSGLDNNQFTTMALIDKAAWSRLALKLLKLFELAQEAVDSAQNLEHLGSVESLYVGLTENREKLTHLSKDKFEFHLNQVLSIISQEPGFRQGASQFLDSLRSKESPVVHLEHPMKDVLRALPCWTVSNLSACGRLPLSPGLFDLVIIDESSQCDIPSCVPLMFRAKQAVIIGDPMQLGQITNLTKRTENSLLHRHDIKYPGSFRYSGNSIYDLAFAIAPSISRTFLAQHYRCHPEIIEFANSSHWYDSQLEPVTDTEQLKDPKNLNLGINWLNVEGKARKDTTGFWIPEEADRITEEVVRLLVEERFEGTLGVVTPFRRMANALQAQIEASNIHQRILEAAQFRADTAHRFQGDERDIIFYSPCYHPDMPNRHKWFLSSQKNVFNVALSRARSAFIVVGPKERLRTCGIDYLENFVEYVDNIGKAVETRSGPPREIQRGHWEPIFEKKLKEENLPIQAQYKFGPFWLDFALLDGKRKLDIEVDGEQFHKNESGMRCQKDIDRNIYLKSRGWSVMRFWVYELRDDIDECVKQVKKWWTEKN